MADGFIGVSFELSSATDAFTRVLAPSAPYLIARRIARRRGIGLGEARRARRSHRRRRLHADHDRHQAQRVQQRLTIDTSTPGISAGLIAATYQLVAQGCCR
jgi:hypothetical protein